MLGVGLVEEDGKVMLGVCLVEEDGKVMLGVCLVEEADPRGLPRLRARAESASADEMHRKLRGALIRERNELK